MSTLPDRTGDAHAAAGKHLHSKAGICLHHGKTKIWNSQGEKPKCADVLEKDARQLQPEAVVWRGNPELLVSKQGLIVLGGAGGPSQPHPGAVGAEGRRAQGVLGENPSHPGRAVSLVASAVLRCSESQLLVEDGPTRINGFFCKTPRPGLVDMSQCFFEGFCACRRCS